MEIQTVDVNVVTHLYKMNIVPWQVIRTLQQAIPRCTQTQALAYANIVDREVRHKMM